MFLPRLAQCVSVSGIYWHKLEYGFLSLSINKHLDFCENWVHLWGGGIYVFISLIFFFHWHPSPVAHNEVSGLWFYPCIKEIWAQVGHQTDRIITVGDLSKMEFADEKTTFAEQCGSSQMDKTAACHSECILILGMKLMREWLNYCYYYFIFIFF